jgi:NCAIR mutase (PurE)-related protein
MDLHLDLDRLRRCGFPEVVFAAGKTVGECVAAATGLFDAHRLVLVTRASGEQLSALHEAIPSGEVHPRCGGFLAGEPPPVAGPVAVVSAGTSDAAVAEEAALTLRARGVEVRRFADCGVAGLHRLLSHIEAIRACRCSVAVAGMDAALATVLGGLVDHPVIGVPTSVGYGVATGGRSALESMLCSCAPGLSVVNIDNGFGGGYAAAEIALAIAGRTDPAC